MPTRETENAIARGPAETTGPLAERAAELALNHGRLQNEVTDADITWAKRELKPLEISSPRIAVLAKAD